MATPTEPRKEHPSTYFVADRSNEEELTRLTIQDRLLTTAMGGVLPEQTDLTLFQKVLDVACGTGGWLIETAKTYPEISLLVGVDVSARMIEYAQEQAENAEVQKRVEFHSMDALRMLEFPTAFFDLVNQRLALSFIRTWDWPKLLTEFRRILRPGGVLRLSEVDVVESNSPALTRRETMLQEAFFQAGHFFAPQKDGVTRELASLMGRYNLTNIQTRIHLLEYQGGTPEGELFAKNVAHSFQTTRPFLRKWTQLTDEYDTMVEQAIREMSQPDFKATWRMLTVWGNTPE